MTTRRGFLASIGALAVAPFFSHEQPALPEQPIELGPPHIFIDGLDPNDPKHQEAIASCLRQYGERVGSPVLTMKSKNRAGPL